jgi:hypothetical protein
MLSAAPVLTLLLLLMLLTDPSDWLLTMCSVAILWTVPHRIRLGKYGHGGGISLCNVQWPYQCVPLVACEGEVKKRHNLSLETLQKLLPLMTKSGMNYCPDERERARDSRQ